METYKLSQAKRVFSEREIYECSGGYPDELEEQVQNMHSPSGLKCSDVMNSLLVFKGGLTDKNKEFNDRVFDCVNKKIITFDNFKEVFNICSSIGKECIDPGLLEILIAELIPFKFEQYQIVRASTLDSSMESYKRIYLTNLLKLFIKMVKKYQFEKETFADFIKGTIVSILHMDDVDLLDNIFMSYIKLISIDIYNVTHYDLRNNTVFEPSKAWTDIEDSIIENIPLYDDTTLDDHGVAFESENVLVNSQSNQILFFGDDIFDDCYIDAVKRDLKYLNKDTIKSYLPDNSGDVQFNVSDNFKMYLKKSLECKILIATMKRDGHVDELPLIEYENEIFLLFTLSGNNENVFGISVHKEDEPDTSRHLVTFFTNDDINYEFIEEI